MTFLSSTQSWLLLPVEDFWRSKASSSSQASYKPDIGFFLSGKKSIKKFPWNYWKKGFFSDIINFNTVKIFHANFRVLLLPVKYSLIIIFLKTVIIDTVLNVSLNKHFSWTLHRFLKKYYFTNIYCKTYSK